MKKLLKKKLKIAARKARKAKRAVLMMQKNGLKRGKNILKRAKKFEIKMPAFNLSKIGALALVIGMILQITGMSPVNTLAYFTDQEDSSNNAMSATSLDFGLEDGGWSAYAHLGGLLPGDSIERSVKVKKLSGLDFRYKVTAHKVAGDADYCNALEIKALRENVELYNGSLLGLNIVPPAVIAADGTDDWKFVLNLPGAAQEFPGVACEFNLEFYGWQQNLAVGGFNDTETLGNVAEGISSGPEVDDFVQGISPIGDSYVDEHSENNNYGGQHNLFVRSKSDNQGNQENRRAFVQFNLPIPPIATVTSASLKLRMTSAPGQDRALEVRRALSAWTENGIEWSNQPSASVTVSDTINTGVLNDVWKSWNVTTDVQGFTDGTFNNHGWRIKDASEGASSSQESAFASREHSSEIYGPVLEIALTAQAATTTHVVVNEVYYHVGSAGVGNDAQNEWVEIYNPTNSPVDVSGWKICDNSGGCDTLPASAPIPAKGFGVITNKATTWGYWPGMPSGAIKIELNSEIGNGLANTGDRVILKNAADSTIDQMSYGTDTTVFNPAIPHSGNGRSVARIIKGYDNDTATDWVINATPNPGTNPSENGEEVMRFTMEGMEIAKSVNDLAPLVDNPTTQTEISTDQNFEPECVCSQATEEQAPAPEPETTSGGGSAGAPEATEEVVSQTPEETASTTPDTEQAPAPETTPTEEVVPPAEAPPAGQPAAEDPAPVIEESPVVQEVPPTEQTPPQDAPQADAPPVVIEPQPALTPAPTEAPSTGGSNE